MSAVNLRVEAPFRPVDWRWEKARLMREDPRTASLLRHQDDDWTRKAKRFQEQKDAARDAYDELLLIRRWPALSAAADIRFKDDEKRLVRYEIEARLMASQTPAEISQRMPQPEAVIAWYEHLFFSVRDRLPYQTWVVQCVLGESAHAGLTERDFDVLWKMYGYSGGAHVLDAVLKRNYGQAPAGGPGQALAWITDDSEVQNHHKMNLAMRTMGVNSYTQDKVAEINIAFRQLRKMADGSGGAGDMMSNNLLGMLGALGWAVGKSTVMVAADDPKRIVGRLRDDVIVADSGAVELRASELTMLNTSQRPAGPRMLGERKFPEKPNATAANQGS